MSTRSFLVNKDAESISPNKAMTLNPNAAEFIPSSLRSLPGNAKDTEVSKLDVAVTSGKAVLDRSESNASNNSDDEAHQYWRRQLPDDITPDFKVMGENEFQVAGGLSLAGLSIDDGIEASRFATSGGSQLFRKQHTLPIHDDEDIGLTDNMRYSGLGYTEDRSSSAFTDLASNPWNKRFGNGDQNNGREVAYTGDSNAAFLNDLVNEYSGLDNTINPLEFLVSQFPGFAAESLADVYYANGCDLNMTIEILTQLELQVDAGFSQNLNSKPLSAPSLTELDFPALPVPDAQNGLSKYAGEDLQQSSNSTYRPVDKGSFPFFKPSPSSALRGAPDFASAVRKLASQDSGHWKYERNGSAAMSVGSSRSSQLSANSYNGHGKSVYMDKLQMTGTTRATPVWLETGDAVGNMYSESREEARDFARLRNACFEQARQAYLIGNKALAKELSVKGQLYNMQMKSAHEKASENIYRQRNQVAPEVQGYSRAQDPLIDLHGLHVNEAIHVLKHELNVLRRTARSAGQRLQVMICVGTGHHTKGSRTPARLPVAVEQYLLDEGLQYSEPQPGLLRVVIY